MALRISRYFMALLYLAAGIYHFVSPGTYVKIMPPYIPAPDTMVALSGVAEVICGLLLFAEQTSRLGAWLTIALLVAVFPANIQMYLNWKAAGHPHLWIAILRLPLQALLIAWAARYRK